MSNILEHVQAVLNTTVGRWEQLTDNFSDEMLRRRPQEGEWCALECLLHLIDVEKHIFPVRVKAMLDGKEFESFDHATHGTTMTDDISAKALVREYKALRAESIKIVASLTVDDLSKYGTHSRLGKITLENHLNEWGGHDLMHIVQAERALMQPFIQGCGVFKPYFADHDANA
jgi:hypothetical protein